MKSQNQPTWRTMKSSIQRRVPRQAINTWKHSKDGVVHCTSDTDATKGFPELSLEPIAHGHHRKSLALKDGKVQSLRVSSHKQSSLSFPVNGCEKTFCINNIGPTTCISRVAMIGVHQ
ncbi:unnamed protein product [Caenorhabditis nigoni]